MSVKGRQSVPGFPFRKLDNSTDLDEESGRN
jgi:hypothetical protein